MCVSLVKVAKKDCALFLKLKKAGDRKKKHATAKMDGPIARSRKRHFGSKKRLLEQEASFSLMQEGSEKSCLYKGK